MNAPTLNTELVVYFSSARGGGEPLVFPTRPVLTDEVQ